MDTGVLLIELGTVVLALGLLGRLAGRIGLSPIPFYLLAGLAFGHGGLIPLAASEVFIGTGAEIGVDTIATNAFKPFTPLYPCPAPCLAYPYVALIVSSMSTLCAAAHNVD